MSLLREKFLALPEKKQKAIRMFSEVYSAAGFECFLVGGSCRDLLLGIDPKDFDFASNCPLSVTKSLFPKVISTGEAHGTLTVLFSGFQFEVTRYRKDVSTDGRRAAIAFADSIEQDQERRDLRLNSLAYDVLMDHLVDSQSAVRDFKEKMIRFVGKAKDRILEDHLRALRYGRMILNLQPLGFSYLTSEMKQVIGVFDNELLSVERLFDELQKMLAVQPRDDLFFSGFLANLRIFNRFDMGEYQSKEVIHSVLESNNLLPLWYAYHKDHDLADTVKTMKLSKHNKRLIQIISEFEHHELSNEAEIKSLLSRATGIKQKELLNSVKHLLKKDIRTAVQTIIADNHPLHIKDLAINGNDLKMIDIEGRKIGLTLEYLLEKVWKQPQINQGHILLKMAAEIQVNLTD